MVITILAILAVVIIVGGILSSIGSAVDSIDCRTSSQLKRERAFKIAFDKKQKFLAENYGGNDD